MKIAMYAVRDTEEPYIKAWEKQTGDVVKRITEQLSPANVDQAADCEGLSILQTEPLTDEGVYKKLHDFGIKEMSLRMVGYNALDLKLAKKYGLTVTNVPTYSPRAIAEMGVTQAMYLLRRIGEYRQRMRDDHDFTWNKDLESNEIYNLTVGLIGTGNIGSATAQIYKALGAHVIAYDPIYHVNDEPYLDFVDSPEEVLKSADIVSLHTPLLPSTEGMIGEKQFKMMKKTAYLINVSRGGLVDTQALINALKNHEIAGAGLDVLADETKFFTHKVKADQVPADYQELAAMPNVIVTPHVAFFTKTAVRNMVQMSLNDINRINEGQKALYVVQQA